MRQLQTWIARVSFIHSWHTILFSNNVINGTKICGDPQ